MEFVWQLIQANLGAVIGGAAGLTGGIVLLNHVRKQPPSFMGSIYTAITAMGAAVAGLFAGQLIHNAIRPKSDQVTGVTASTVDLGNGEMKEIVLSHEHITGLVPDMKSFLDQYISGNKDLKNNANVILRGKSDGKTMTISQIEINKEGLRIGFENINEKLNTIRKYDYLELTKGLTANLPPDIRSFKPNPDPVTGKYVYTLHLPVKIELSNEGVPSFNSSNNVAGLREIIRQAGPQMYPKPKDVTYKDAKIDLEWKETFFNWNAPQDSRKMYTQMMVNLPRKVVEDIAKQEGADGIVKLITDYVTTCNKYSSSGYTLKDEDIKKLSDHLKTKITDQNFADKELENHKRFDNLKTGKSSTKMRTYLWGDGDKDFFGKELSHRTIYNDIEWILRNHHKSICSGLKAKSQVSALPSPALHQALDQFHNQDRALQTCGANLDQPEAPKTPVAKTNQPLQKHTA